MVVWCGGLRVAERGRIASATAVRRLSTVTFSAGRCTPAPAASSSSAFVNWSTACGMATVGTPNHSDSAAPPIPAWVMSASACAGTSSCGCVRAAFVLAGAGPSLDGSILPVAMTSRCSAARASTQVR